MRRSCSNWACSYRITMLRGNILEAFMRWQRTAADIQKIIGDVLGRGLPEADAQA